MSPLALSALLWACAIIFACLASAVAALYEADKKDPGVAFLLWLLFSALSLLSAYAA